MPREVIARGGVFLAVALPDHLEQIAVFECLQRFDIVDLLQAQDVGTGRGDSERGQLAGIIGMRDRAGLFEQPVFRLVPDREKRQACGPDAAGCESRKNRTCSSGSRH